MAAHIDRIGIRIFAGAEEEHIPHRVYAHGKSGFFAPALKQFAAFAVLIGQGLAVIATAHTRADLGHVHQTVPKTIAIDSKIAGEHHALCLRIMYVRLNSGHYTSSPYPPANICSHDPALWPQYSCLAAKNLTSWSNCRLEERLNMVKRF